MKKACRFDLRLQEHVLNAIKKAASERGYASVAAFVRAAIDAEMRHGETALDRTEQNIGASIDRLAREIRRLHTTQQAVFALTDSLIRLFLTCVPEPPPEVLDQAKRRARQRYDRFLKSVAQSMTTDSRAALAELVTRE